VISDNLVSICSSKAKKSKRGVKDQNLALPNDEAISKIPVKNVISGLSDSTKGLV
jgi:hypothetical protein